MKRWKIDDSDVIAYQSDEGTKVIILGRYPVLLEFPEKEKERCANREEKEK